FLLQLFEGVRLRRYEGPDGRIVHAEIRSEDSVVMISNSNEAYPPNEFLMHLYVPDVDKTFQKAIDLGCESIQEPKIQSGDPDRRGSFRDPYGHFWSVATQVGE